MSMKYRIWDIENNKYFEPTYDAPNGKIEELLMSPLGQLNMRTLNGFSHESMFPDRFEVEYYIGIKDKNDIELCQADIYRNHGQNNQLAVVGRGSPSISVTTGHGDCSFSGGINYISGYGDGSEIEKVGNIHENNDLWELMFEYDKLSRKGFGKLGDERYQKMIKVEGEISDMVDGLIQIKSF